MQIKKICVFIIATLFIVVGVSCSNGDSPDGPDAPVTPVGQTVFMFFPWSNSLLSDFRRTVEDMQTIVAQRSMKDERIMVFMATRTMPDRHAATLQRPPVHIAPMADIALF